MFSAPPSAPPAEVYAQPPDSAPAVNIPNAFSKMDSAHTPDSQPGQADFSTTSAISTLSTVRDGDKVSLLNPEMYGRKLPGLRNMENVPYWQKLCRILGIPDNRPEQLLSRYSDGDFHGLPQDLQRKYSVGNTSTFFYQRIVGDLLASPRYADRGLIVNYEVGAGKTMTAMYFIKAVLMQLNQDVGLAGYSSQGGPFFPPRSGFEAGYTNVGVQQVPKPALNKEALDFEAPNEINAELRDRFAKTVMILVPNQALVHNWRTELIKFLPHVANRFREPNKHALEIDLNLHDFVRGAQTGDSSARGAATNSGETSRPSPTLRVLIQNATYVRKDARGASSGLLTKTGRDTAAGNFYFAFLRLASRSKDLVGSQSSLSINRVLSLTTSQQAEGDLQPTARRCARAVGMLLQNRTSPTILRRQAMEDLGFLGALQVYLSGVLQAVGARSNAERDRPADTSVWKTDFDHLAEIGLTLDVLEPLVNTTLQAAIHQHPFADSLGSLGERRTMQDMFVPRYVIVDEAHNFVLPNADLESGKQQTIRNYKTKLESSIDQRIMVLTATPMAKATSLSSFYALANLVLGPGRWLYCSPPADFSPRQRKQFSLERLVKSLEGVTSFVSLSAQASVNPGVYPQVQTFCLPRSVQGIQVFFAAPADDHPRPQQYLLFVDEVVELLRKRLQKLPWARGTAGSLVQKTQVANPAFGALALATNFLGATTTQQALNFAVQHRQTHYVLALEPSFQVRDLFRTLPYNMCACLLNPLQPSENLDDLNLSLQHLVYMASASGHVDLRTQRAAEGSMNLGLLSPMVVETASTALSASSAGTFRIGIADRISAVELESVFAANVALLRPNVVYFKDGLEQRDAERRHRFEEQVRDRTQTASQEAGELVLSKQSTPLRLCSAPGDAGVATLLEYKGKSDTSVIRARARSRIASVLTNILRLPRTENHVALVPRIGSLLSSGEDGQYQGAVDQFNGRNKELLFGLVQDAASYLQGTCYAQARSDAEQAELLDWANPDGGGQQGASEPAPCQFRVFNAKKLMALLLGVRLPSCCDLKVFSGQTSVLHNLEDCRNPLFLLLAQYGLRHKKRGSDEDDDDDGEIRVPLPEIMEQLRAVLSTMLESLETSDEESNLQPELETGSGTSSAAHVRFPTRALNVFVDSQLQESSGKLDGDGKGGCGDLQSLLDDPDQGIKALLSRPPKGFASRAFPSGFDKQQEFFQNLEPIMFDLMKRVFNHARNRRGRYCSVMFLNHSKEEGVSFMNVRNFHIVFENGHQKPELADKEAKTATQEEEEQTTEVRAPSAAEKLRRQELKSSIPKFNPWGSTGTAGEEGAIGGFEANRSQKEFRNNRNWPRTNVFEPIFNISAVKMADVVDFDSLFALDSDYARQFTLQEREEDSKKPAVAQHQKKSGNRNPSGQGRKRKGPVVHPDRARMIQEADFPAARDGASPSASGYFLRGSNFEPTKRQQQIGRVMRSRSHADFGESREDQFVRPWLYLDVDRERYRPYDVRPIASDVVDVVRQSAVDCALLSSFHEPGGPGPASQRKVSCALGLGNLGPAFSDTSVPQSTENGLGERDDLLPFHRQKDGVTGTEIPEPFIGTPFATR